MSFWYLIGGLRGAIVAIVAVAATWGAAYLYNVAIDNPHIAREARNGYVLQAEKEALQAQITEEKRQRAVAQLVAQGLRKEVDRLTDEQRLAEERREQGIAEYEKKLRDANRDCYLDESDIEWLRSDN